MESIAVTGDLRTEFGKKSAKAARRAGLVPCVIYGGENVVHFTASPKIFKPLIFTPDFKLVEITVDGTAYKCILKAASYHPVTDELEHMDFLQLTDGKTLRVEIPLHFKGIAPGVKTGGKLIPKVRRIKIKTTPEKLVDKLYVDISGMNLGDSVRVRDIEILDGMEVMNSPGIPVASVEVPRALKSAAAGAEAEAAAAEEEEEPAATE